MVALKSRSNLADVHHDVSHPTAFSINQQLRRCSFAICFRVSTIGVVSTRLNKQSGGIYRCRRIFRCQNKNSASKFVHAT